MENLELNGAEFDVCELFSPPRVSLVAAEFGLKGGYCLDKVHADEWTGRAWDFVNQREQAQLERLQRAEEQKQALIAFRAAVAADKRIRGMSAARVKRQAIQDANDSHFCESVLPQVTERSCRQVSRSPRRPIQATFGACKQQQHHQPSHANSAGTSS